jgi:hypothetical protein
MALTLAELQAQRDNIVQSINVARVQHGEMSVDYVTDKQKSLALIDAEIAKRQTPQAKVFTISTNRGLS